jgi:hypothetical protein
VAGAGAAQTRQIAHPDARDRGINHLESARVKYLLFIWKPSGYELRERDGELPSVGSVLDEEDGRMVVTRIGPSPLPGDSRRCAYLQAA